jgi:hypothetical protein
LCAAFGRRNDIAQDEVNGKYDTEDDNKVLFSPFPRRINISGIVNGNKNFILIVMRLTISTNIIQYQNINANLVKSEEMLSRRNGN